MKENCLTILQVFTCIRKRKIEIRLSHCHLALENRFLRACKTRNTQFPCTGQAVMAKGHVGILRQWKEDPRSICSSCLRLRPRWGQRSKQDFLTLKLIGKLHWSNVEIQAHFELPGCVAWWGIHSNEKWICKLENTLPKIVLGRFWRQDSKVKTCKY